MYEERKIVTILFADVAGSTALGETLDPEDVRALMGRYYEHAHQIIVSNGGTIEKFIGDAVMAVFGLPQVHGNDTERALASAIALRDTVAADALLSERLILRIGINTGEVVTTSDPSSGEFLVTGDAVNVAARLQQVARSGEIVIGERTVTTSQAAFLFGEERSTVVKGKQHPLRFFPLLGRQTIRQVMHPSLVGREHDLAHLTLLLQRVTQERRPHMLSLVAPAGAGKTRLLEALLARIDGKEQIQVATAQCLPYGEDLIYWPLRSLFTTLVGAELTPLEAARQAAKMAFVHAGYLLADASRLTEYLLTTLGLKQEGANDRESLFAAWQLLIEGCANEAPHILIFEDLHWASDGLLDLVEHLMNPRARVPLLLIVLSRPELLDRRPFWGGGHRNFTALLLDPLSESEIRELIGQPSNEVPETVYEQIIERSGGNPFFALELMRGLAERRSPEDSTTTRMLPDTIHEAMLARLDLLSPGERAVVYTAAVAGQTFQPAAIQAMLDTMEAPELTALLEKLSAKDFFVPTERGAFTFRHSVIREVAYGVLPRTERIRLHAKIAAWIERDAADQLDAFTELIASHYRTAVTLAHQAAVPLALPFDIPHAVYVLEQAGMSASRACAFSEANAFLQSAIKSSPEQERLRLYEQLGDALTWGDTSIEAYGKALTLWHQAEGQSPLIGARLLRKLLITYLRWWEASISPSQEKLGQWVVEAQQLADRAGDEDELWRIRLAEIWWLLYRGRKHASNPQELEQARALALDAATYFERRANWAAFSEALDGYSALSHRMGALQDMINTSQRRLNVSALPLTERGDALNVMASAYLYLCETQRCIELVDEALAQLRPGDPVVHLASGVVTALQALFISGRWPEIEALKPILMKIWEQTQGDRGLAKRAIEGYLTLLNVAVAREDSAAIQTATSILEQCLPAVSVNARSLLVAYREDDAEHIIIDLSDEEWAVDILVFLNEHGGDIPEALLAHMRSWPWANEMVRQYVAIAEALAAQDGTRLMAAIQEAEIHNLVTHAARMRIILAQKTHDQAPLERARPVLQRLGDRRGMRRLEEVMVTVNQARKSDVNTE